MSKRGPSSQRSERYQVTVSTSQERFDQYIEPAERGALAALAAEHAPAGARVDIVLVADDEIAEYHLRYMQISGPTDVLSWPVQDHLPTENEVLGDIMISCETAERHARELGHSTAREVAVLSAHGVLHLLGWDDLTEHSRDRMQSRVDEIVAPLGL